VCQQDRELAAVIFPKTLQKSPFRLLHLDALTIVAEVTTAPEVGNPILSEVTVLPVKSAQAREDLVHC
jgi:hypothetical protein